MSYFDRYQRRLKSKGNNPKEAHEHSTKNFIDKNFSSYPDYKVVKVDGVDVETRVVMGRKRDDKELILKSDTIVNLGGLVKIDDDDWLIYSTTKGTLVNKAFIRLCNESLKWNEGTTTYQYPCFVDAYTAIDTYDTERKTYMDMDLQSGGLYAFTQINPDTMRIKDRQRFVLGSRIYEVTGMDDVTLARNGIGVVKVTLRIVPARETDDINNNVADNSGDSGGGLW